MSQFRDKFVGNADSQSVLWYSPSVNSLKENSKKPLPSTPFTENTRTRPYSPIDNGSKTTPVFNNELPIDDRSSDSLSPNRKYNTNYSAESYELSHVSQNPFQSHDSSQRVSNPFQNSEYPSQQGYSVVPEQNAAAFTNENEAQSEKYLLDKHMVREERNRRKLASRLPRLHYTKLPWFTILVTTAQVIVFIVELVKMGIWTGSPFQTKPYFNPMLGPSTYVLINMGARYVPCMHKISGVTSDTSISFPCPNSTSTDTNVCNLNELCGLSGVPIIDNSFLPSQYYRIVLPIFLHAGILHIFFNMVLQLTMGVAIERAIGWLKYSIIYISSGVSGFLLGANFSPNGVASTGASGSLFGVIAANFLLFIYCGTKNTNIHETKRYKTFIFIMILEIVVSFVLGLLPGLDNFSHIGGFCMGILTSILLLPDPSFVFIDGIYTYDPAASTWKLFIDNWNPFCKFKNKVAWKVAAWAAARVASLALAIVYFALLTKNLKSKKEENNEETCSWCKYINCIPVKGWCEQGEVTVSVSSGIVPTATPTASATGSQTNASPIFNAPTQTANVKREIMGQPHYMVFEGTSRLPVGAKSLEHDIKSDSGIVAVLVVVALLGYNATKRLKAKARTRSQKKKEEKKEKRQRVVL